MITFKIDEDTRFVKINLDRLTLQNKDLIRKVFRAVGNRIKKYIKNEELSGQVLNRRSGRLAKSIKYSVSGKTMMLGTSYFVGRIFEGGIDTVTRQGKRLKLAARQFVWKGIDKIFESGEAQNIAEEAEDKWLEETFNK